MCSRRRRTLFVLWQISHSSRNNNDNFINWQIPIPIFIKWVILKSITRKINSNSSQKQTGLKRSIRQSNSKHHWLTNGLLWFEWKSMARLNRPTKGHWTNSLKRQNDWIITAKNESSLQHCDWRILERWVYLWLRCL